MSSYQVTAPLVLAKDRTGKVRYHYYDTVIPWLSKAQATHLLDLDLVTEIPDVPEEVSEGEVGQELPDPDVAEMPNRVSPKAEWVAYAAATHDISEEEADELTKAELIERFG